jgi:hypothetical protein
MGGPPAACGALSACQALAPSRQVSEGEGLVPPVRTDATGRSGTPSNVLQQQHRNARISYAMMGRG